MPEFSDEQLVYQYIKGDETALDLLIKRYLKLIYSFAYRYVGSPADAEDITQKVFIQMWRNIRKFDRKRSFKIWLFKIAKNASIDFLRKKKSIPFSKFEKEDGKNIITDTITDPSPLSSELCERADDSRILNISMQKLPLKYRAVLSLRYNDHFTFREIAESLGEPINTIISQHRRALSLLKKILPAFPI